MVEYVFTLLAASILGVIEPTINTDTSHWLSKQTPSDLHLALGVSIRMVVCKNHLKMRLLVIIMAHYTIATANLFDI